MPTGAIKFLHYDRGYGFIAPANSGPDVFVRTTTLEVADLGDLGVGDEVEFVLVTDVRTGKSSAEDLRMLQRTANKIERRVAPSFKPPMRGPKKVQSYAPGQPLNVRSRSRD
jgi:CspA family cold shock protein